MKKLFLPVMFLSALALSGATVPAVATPVAAPAVVESVEAVTADPSAVLSVDTVAVATVPAPAPVEPTPAPAPVEPSVAPAEPVAAPVESTPVPAPVEPVAPAVDSAESYVPTPPVVECHEDEPCWDCTTMGNKICGNPVCKEQNRFTVDTAGTCSTAPVGWTEADVRADGNAIGATIGRPYLASGSNAQMLRREGFTYIESDTIPSTIHVFG